MTVKKNMQKRIRGWLPKEANLPKAIPKMDFRTISKPMVPGKLGQGKVRTAKVIGVNNCIIIVIFTLLSYVNFNAQTGLTIAKLVVGFVFGLASAAWVAPRIIKRTESHKDSLGWKEYLGVTIPAIILILLFNQVGSYSSFYFVFAWSTTYWLVQMFQFLSYEKKKKVFIIQDGWLGVVYFLVPQANDSLLGETRSISSELKT
jgi:hypothetical protein